MSLIAPQPPEQLHRYRRVVSFRDGFSTSICDLFSNPSRKSDCCAIIWCGLFVSDRNHFLALGNLPPPWWERILINLVFPATICVTMFATIGQSYPVLSLTFALLGFIALLKRGQHYRAKVRLAVMERMSVVRGEHLQIESQKAWQVHAPCSSSPANDTIYRLENKDADDGDDSDEHLHEKERSFLQLDFCAMIWNFSRLLCCGCFGCWCQCCGMCAVGQEDREMQLILSKQEFHMDYVTFEPYIDYFPKILSLRDRNVSSFREHASALSNLSRYMVQSLLVSILAFGVIAISPVPKGITFAKFLVFIGIFFQAFLILYFAHWKWNRLDLSFDAVVKYFSSGFVICSGLALTYEFLMQMIFRSFAIVSFILISVDEKSTEMAKQEARERSHQFTFHHNKELVEWKAGVKAFSVAFLTAALVEELVKYFSYWMVEHPDFVSPIDMVDTAIDTEAGNQTNKSYGSVVCEEEIQRLETTDSAQNNNNKKEEKRKLLSKRTAITVAMMTTATGFACFENFLYVFVYAPPGISNEIPTLVMRSLFPLHPIAAAIQSIGVIRRDLEGDNSYGLGRIFLPAFLYHGSFDFALMFLSALNDLQVEESNSWNTPTFQMFLGYLIFCLGIFYYIYQAEAQHYRLVNLD